MLTIPRARNKGGHEICALVCSLQHLIYQTASAVHKPLEGATARKLVTQLCNKPCLQSRATSSSLHPAKLPMLHKTERRHDHKPHQRKECTVNMFSHG